MIYFKHVAYLSIVFALAPIVARLIANAYVYRFRLAPIPAGLPLILGSIVSGLLAPLAAQAMFDALSQTGLQPMVIRMIALGTVAGIYALLIGFQPYFLWPRAVVLGVAGGCLVAYLYSILPGEPWALLIYGMILAGLPLLSLEAVAPSAQRRFRAGWKSIPYRGLWH